MSPKLPVLLFTAAAVLVARTTWDGVYTAEQAKRGITTYAAKCSSCHGETMGGGGGVPPVSGPAFLFSWNGKSAAELLDYLKTSMPPTEPGSLSDARYADVMAAIFERSGFPAGKDELPTDPKLLDEIRITREKP